MEEKAAVLLKVCPRDGLAAGMLSIEGRGPQHDLLAAERAVALPNRHRRLPRVVPNGGEGVRLGIEARDSGAGTFRSISIDESEIRLQRLSVVHHVRLTRAFSHDRLPVHREERFLRRPSRPQIARAASEHPSHRLPHQRK